MKIGVISDTHGYLDPRVEKIFAGVNRVLHAGDIGYPALVLELEFIAPVTAVRGNTDDDFSLALTKTVTVDGLKFLVHHIVNPHSLPDSVAHQIAKERPNAVIFGHTHKAFAETIDGIFYFNPGYSGKPRHGTERSVAILHLENGQIRHEFIPL